MSSISSHRTSKSAPRSFGKDESIWHVCFESYKEFLLLVLCRECGAGPRCWRSSGSGCFAGSPQRARPVPGGQSIPIPGPGGCRLREAAPQRPGEVAQRAAAAAGIPHGQPGVHVGLGSPVPAAVRERSRPPPARLPAERQRFPARPGGRRSARSAQVPLEVTAALLRAQGSTWVRFAFILQSPDLASPPRIITLFYSEGGWHRVLRNFSTAFIIMLLGEPDVCFKGPGAALNLLKMRENPVITQF